MNFEVDTLLNNGWQACQEWSGLIGFGDGSNGDLGGSDGGGNKSGFGDLDSNF